MKIHSLIIAATLSVSSAWAWSEEPMRFFYDKKTKSITASGQIVKGSYEDFTVLLSHHRDAEVLILDSTSMGGGAAAAMMLMKETVKERKLKTISFGSCWAGCASIFNAGQERRLGNLQIFAAEDKDLLEYQAAFKRAHASWGNK